MLNKIFCFFFQGHNKSITALAVSPDKKTIFTASHDAAINILLVFKF